MPEAVERNGIKPPHIHNSDETPNQAYRCGTKATYPIKETSSMKVRLPHPPHSVRHLPLKGKAHVTYSVYFITFSHETFLQRRTKQRVPPSQAFSLRRRCLRSRRMRWPREVYHDDNEMRCSEEADPFDDTIMYLIRRNTFFFASEHTYLK